MFRLGFLLLLLSFVLVDVYGQNDIADSLETKEILVQATRLESSWLNATSSISTQQIDDTYEGYAKTSLKELLNRQPGIFNQNANNYAQDLRISIRGFGARSAFGIQGVRLMVDGIPESTPDGQAQIDNLALDNIKKVEVLRGPSSGLYGNASGGVISLMSDFEVKKNYLQVSSLIGSYGVLKQNLNAGIKLGKSDIKLSGTHFKTDGYRDHSSSTTGILSGTYQYKSDNNLKVRITGNYTNSPEALDPGGVTLEDANLDQRAARLRNVDFNAGEKIEHFKIGSTISKLFNDKKLSVTTFYHNRQFEGGLPFVNGGYIQLDRNFFGQSGQLTFYQEKNRLLVGYDVQVQRDTRERFNNDMGAKGDLTLHQNENFKNYAIYLIDNIEVSQKLNVDLNLRFDKNDISVDDFFGDNTDQVNMDALSYGLGVGYLIQPELNSFLRVSSSFETPTLSELLVDPRSNGLNRDLSPLSSINYEIGIKSNTQKNLSWQTSLFYIRSENEIISFELEDFPGRDFFRNAGSTKRFGLEVMGTYEVPDKYFLNCSYTYSRFRFDDYVVDSVDLSDNTIPGIPDHNINFEFGFYLPYNFKVQSYNTYMGQLYAEDENIIRVDAYLRSDFKVGKSVEIGDLKVNIYGGVNNIFNQAYFDNVRINAFGARHYEPAPLRNYYVGLRFNIE